MKGLHKLIEEQWHPKNLFAFPVCSRTHPFLLASQYNLSYFYKRFFATFQDQKKKKKSPLSLENHLLHNQCLHKLFSLCSTVQHKGNSTWLSVLSNNRFIYYIKNIKYTLGQHETNSDDLLNTVLWFEQCLHLC